MKNFKSLNIKSVKIKNFKGLKEVMEFFFNVTNVKSPKEAIESFFGIKNFNSRKKVTESFFSIKNFKSWGSGEVFFVSFNSFKSRKKVTESFFIGHASSSFHTMHKFPGTTFSLSVLAVLTEFLWL